jgi:hypothetical protein
VGSNAEVLAGAWRAYAGGDVEALVSLMCPDATSRDDTRERRGKVCVCRDGAAIGVGFRGSAASMGGTSKVGDRSR